MKKIHSGLLVLAGAWLCLGSSPAAAQASAASQVNGDFIRANAAQKKRSEEHTSELQSLS